MTSNRSPRRGHWPKNVARNPEPPPAVVAALGRIGKRAKTLPAGPAAGPQSINRTAARIGVDSRTLRRWIAGEDWPAEVYWDGILAELVSVAY